jgi:hypothetical protein
MSTFGPEPQGRPGPPVQAVPQASGVVPSKPNIQSVEPNGRHMPVASRGLVVAEFERFTFDDGSEVACESAVCGPMEARRRA